MRDWEGHLLQQDQKLVADDDVHSVQQHSDTGGLALFIPIGMTHIILIVFFMHFRNKKVLQI
jgi:hypothetical protein